LPAVTCHTRSAAIVVTLTRPLSKTRAQELPPRPYGAVAGGRCPLGLTHR